MVPNNPNIIPSVCNIMPNTTNIVPCAPYLAHLMLCLVPLILYPLTLILGVGRHEFQEKDHKKISVWFIKSLILVNGSSQKT